MKIIEFPALDSTSTYVADNVATLEHGTLITTPHQRAGRGQRGNSWESEPGKNLTFTAFMRPASWEARRQFLISEAVALAIADTLTEQAGIECKVKWPNDIYAINAGDGSVGKICGILISHALEGTLIKHTLIGAGVNVNQIEFLSDAPNPVSIKQLTGKETDLRPLLEAIAARIEANLNYLWSNPEAARDIHDRYMRHLWRGDGKEYQWIDTATDETFSATLFAVEPLGHLVLRDEKGALRRYAFKEVIFKESFT